MYNASKIQDDSIMKARMLMEEFEIDGADVDFVNLSESQKTAISLFKAGRNVAIMGAAGCGKSYLIREMKYQTEKLCMSKKIVITATTGIAAYNLNGITINSFLGIGNGEQDIDTIIKRVRRKVGVRDRIRSTDIIVIDEVSMMSAELFEKTNALLQAIRKSSAPFGGIQVVLSFDMLQLLPVFNRNTSLFKDAQDTRLIFESDVFKRYFNTNNTITLVENFRQTNSKFKDTLQRIRNGEQTVEDIDMLKTRLVSNLKPKTEELQDAVHLVSSNKQAQMINLSNLSSISSDAVSYKSEFGENGDKEICSELTKELHNQFAQKGINEITLKKGARVMLLKNLSVEEGLVNGSVGTIEKFGDHGPVVKFDNGVKREITPVEWVIEFGENCSKAVQVPLMLCWAITIHKCQSLTLDKAIMSLGDAFCDHMIYVALSRVRSIEGLYLKSFAASKITVNERVKEFLRDNSS